MKVAGSYQIEMSGSRYRRRHDAGGCSRPHAPLRAAQRAPSADGAADRGSVRDSVRAMRAVRTIPVLRIFDEAKAREFYLGFLGFQVDFEHRFGDNFPLFMQVSRDGCVVRLSEHHGDACPGAAVTFMIEGIADLCTELAGKDYRYAKPDVTKSEWNTLDMSIVDPFGNRLGFSEAVPSQG